MIKFGTTDDLVEVTDALSRIYERPFDVSFVKWLSECPYGANLWFVVRDAGEIVAVMGMLPCVMDIGGVVYRGMLANNGGVVKKCRGNQLFTDLGMYALKGINGMPAVGACNDAALKSHLAAGWTKAGELELLSGKMFADPMIWISLPKEPEPQFSFVHTKPWADWRYRKPNEIYVRGEGDWFVYKLYENRRQMIDPPPGYRNSRLLSNGQRHGFQGDDGMMDIWRMKGTVASEALKGVGFKSLYTRHMIVHGAAVGIDGEYRMDLCDNDTF